MSAGRKSEMRCPSWLPGSQYWEMRVGGWIRLRLMCWTKSGHLMDSGMKCPDVW